MARPQHGSGSTSHHSSIEIEITISANKLTGNGDPSEINPMCVVFNLPHGRDWQEYARTEILRNTHEPRFSNKIKIPYCFGERQKLKLQLFNTDGNSRSLSQHEYLGKVECTIGQIVAARTFEAALMLNNSTQQGLLIITAKDQRHEELELVFSASQLKKSGLFFTLPNPFLEISNSSNVPIKRTKCLSNTKNPQWPQLSLPLRALRNERGEYAQLTLKCFSYKEDEEHQLLGEAQIPSRQLLEAPANFNLKKNNADKGEIQLMVSKMKRVYSFLDYLSNGLQLHCTFAVDLSASNGDPRDSKSLHHLGTEPTQYEHIIKAIGLILQDYCKDQLFSLLGFGARSAPVSHELRVKGIESILQAYRTCLETVKLGESRSFAAPIEHVIRTAKSSAKEGGNYFLLFILTDGGTPDLNTTAKAIKEASDVPMSIIFVGIGSADFSTMTLLEAETKKSGHNSPNEIRDNVQFALFRDFSASRDITSAGFNFVKHLLSDLPDQICAYMKLKGVLPFSKTIMQ